MALSVPSPAQPMDTMMEDKTSVSVTMAIMTTMLLLQRHQTFQVVLSSHWTSTSPPRKTVPVKPPPTTPSTTNLSSKTTPSDPDPTNSPPSQTTSPAPCPRNAAGGDDCGLTSTTTTESSCPTNTSATSRYAACEGLESGIADHLFALFSARQRPRHDGNSDESDAVYFDEAVVSTCDAAVAILGGLQRDKTSKTQFKQRNYLVSTVMRSTVTNGCRKKAQGFSKGEE
ncbi:hypothetical protein EDD86DRAFT_258351, partial [Gorgonomyces haynaldii]